MAHFSVIVFSIRWITFTLSNTDCTAVEFFPREEEVVNEVNMRHFWSMQIETPLQRR